MLLALPPLHASGNVWQLLLDGRGKGGGAACAGPFPLPFPSVGPGGRPWSAPGGAARCQRTASGSVGPRWCKANEGALLLRYVWSWRGARRARGEHSTDEHETRWADVRREPVGRREFQSAEECFHLQCKLWLKHKKGISEVMMLHTSTTQNGFQHRLFNAVHTNLKRYAAKKRFQGLKHLLGGMIFPNSISLLLTLIQIHSFRLKFRKV